MDYVIRPTGEWVIWDPSLVAWIYTDYEGQRWASPNPNAPSGWVLIGHEERNDVQPQEG